MKSTKNSKVINFIINQKVYIILVIIMIYLSIATSTFLSFSNLANLIRQNSYTIIVALAFTFILGIGDIDLSVGAALGFGGVIAAGLMVNYSVPIWISIIVCIVSCVVIGLINAFFVNVLGLTSFIVTLATQQILRGTIYVMTGNAPIYGMPNSFLNIAQGALIGDIPNPIAIMVIMAIVMGFIAKRTKFGRNIIAMGGNASAATACGINISKVRYLVYLVAGLCVGISSVLLTGRSASAQNGAGTGLEMDCIAACVIGGTSLNGGKANIPGTVAGVLIVGVVANGLNLLRVDSNWQTVVKGIMILFAVCLDVVSTKVVESVKRKKVLRIQS